jgi:hypothetical protein
VQWFAPFSDRANPHHQKNVRKTSETTKPLLSPKFRTPLVGSLALH